MPTNPNSPPGSPPSPADHSLHINSLTSGHVTGSNDPLEWHNEWSHNAIANDNAMNVNVPCHRKGSVTWNAKPDLYARHQVAPSIPITAQSSNDHDYRGIIDDLTVEIQQLKKELKRYKKPGPTELYKDELFEIRVHGLPQKKKRELDAILGDFATNVDGSPKGSSSQKRTRVSPHNRNHTYAESGIQRKRAPSSRNSSLRPTDSAYASMSTGGESSRTPLNHPILTSTQPSKGEVEDYLRDVPDGLYPQHAIMTDRERKSLVVRRLEQLFTGRDYIADILKTPLVRPGGSFIMVGDVADGQVTDQSPAHELPTDRHEPIREARILPPEQQFHTRGNDCHLSNSVSPSDTSKDSMKTGGNDEDSVSGTKSFPPLLLLPKQRATRPCDLDPDRAQVPYENVDYIRHLDLLAPELLPRQQSSQGVDLDAEGWVSLNLLYNLAQLHLTNVTTDFVRSAVSENSTRLQLSTDGHKILWQGGSKDTKFSSYISGYNTSETPSVGNVDKSEKRRERQKISRFTSNRSQLSGLGNDVPAFDPQLCTRVENFRYKPLFAQQNSSLGRISRGGSVSSATAANNDNSGKSNLGLGNLAWPAGRRQHHEGAITYYSGAPFCIDLTGDPTNFSQTACTPLSSQTRDNSQQPSDFARYRRRTTSGSSISYRPLTDQYQDLRQRIPAKARGNNNEVQDLMIDSSQQSSYIELDCVWNDDQQDIRQQLLEPCGLGVLPHDHFRVVVDTKRPKQDILRSAEPEIGRPKESMEETVHQKVATWISGSVPGGSETKITKGSCPIGIKYLSWRTEKLVPVPLPSPARFFPPLSTNSSISGEDSDLYTAADDIRSLEKDAN
ncbi:frequency clock protein [Fusarium flagelliforme]|uniref:frequency clock protein n=1 Tax=Fusarium flagelliforme TaxID=2675880 RepID=UPI001E8DC5DF|nr:frequency clock protein [Fusarium flagelliforme]XP_045983765.1 frequency clock protein [Fusarium flagelliforme]KAH7169794.1 frequency clock protein [Fusarium flagelliforme]KAH7186133.1 frequency clock protein [Fusarium flagelliforme]